MPKTENKLILYITPTAEYVLAAQFQTERVWNTKIWIWCERCPSSLPSNSVKALKAHIPIKQ